MHQLGKVISILGIALAIGVGISSAGEKSANNWFDMAFQETDLDKKIEYYHQAILLDPQDPETHNNLGVLYKKKGMYAEAIREYETALAIAGYKTPEYAYHNLGVLYKDRIMYEQAIDSFKQAIQKNPEFLKAYNALGSVYKALGRYEEASDSFKQALQIDPNYVQASYNLQNLWRLSAEDTDAKRQAEALYDEGVKLLGQDNPQAAIAKFQETLKLNPQHAGAKKKLDLLQNKAKFDKWSKLGEDFVAQKQWKQALSSFDKALNYAANENERQHIAARKKKTKLQLRRQAQKAEVDRLYKQGLDSLNNKVWLEAISKFTKILMLDSQHQLAQEKNKLARAGHYYEKGLGLLKEQRWQKAEENFNNALKVNPQHADAQQQLKIIAEHYQQEKIEHLLQQAKQARKAEILQTAEEIYQTILGLDANQAEAKAGLEAIRQLIKEDAKPEWVSLLGNSIWLISFVVIALSTGYLLFAKVIRPSQVLNYYLKYKEYDKTRAIYEKILENDDNRRSIYPSLANVYINLKYPEGVKRLIQRCQHKLQHSAKSEKAFWHLALGEIYQYKEKLDEAQREMELAYEGQPHNQEILQKLASLYSVMLSLGTEDTQIVTKLGDLNAKLKAMAETASEGSSLPMEVEQQEAKAKKETEGGDAIQMLKECFGNSKG